MSKTIDAGRSPDKVGRNLDEKKIKALPVYSGMDLR